MKAIIIPLVLQLLGITIVFAEIFIPSGGLLGIIAAGVFAYSLFVVFNEISSTVGYYFLVTDIIGLPFLIFWGIKILSKSSATLNKTLSSKDGVISQDPTLEAFLNQHGVALADLRPSGPALFDHQRLDVVTRGEYVDKGSRIKVVSVIANQIVVSVRDSEKNESPAASSGVSNGKYSG